MQNYTPPGGWGLILHFLHENRMAIQGAFTRFQPRVSVMNRPLLPFYR